MQKEVDGSIYSDGKVKLPERVCGVILTQGVARLEGDIDLYLRLLRGFIARYAHVDQEIQAALADKDMQMAERVAHTVKGVASNLAAVDLAAASHNLEWAIKTGEVTDSLLTQFKSTLREVVTSLGALLAAEDVDETETVDQCSPVLDSKVLVGLLVEFTNMLEGKDFQVGQQWQVIRPFLSKYPRETITELENCLDQFDFDGALKILCEIRGLT